MSGVLLIHADRLSAPAHVSQCRHWEVTGRAWWHPHAGWWALDCELPHRTLDSLVMAGWPLDALEIGGR